MSGPAEKDGAPHGDGKRQDGVPHEPQTRNPVCAINIHVGLGQARPLACCEEIRRESTGRAHTLRGVVYAPRREGANSGSVSKSSL
jgi:hypothetical protein